jgi:hypothetical protein
MKRVSRREKCMVKKNGMGRAECWWLTPEALAVQEQRLRGSRFKASLGK